MEKKEKIFAEGIWFNRPNPQAPEYIKGSISVKGKQFFEFVKKHVNDKGYVNLVLKQSQQGNLYLELDTWTGTKKEEKPQAAPAPEVITSIDYPDTDIKPDDIPF